MSPLGLLLLIRLSISTAGTWSSFSGVTVQLEGAAAADPSPTNTTGFLYIVGGKNGDKYSRQLYRINKIFSSVEQNDLPETIQNTSYCTFTRVNTGLLLLGGEYNNTALSLARIYYTDNQTWDNISALPTPLYKHCAAASSDGEFVVIYGGIDDKNHESTTVYICRRTTEFKATKLNMTSVLTYPPSISAQLTFWKSDGTNTLFILTGGNSSNDGFNSSIWQLNVTATTVNNQTTFTGEWKQLYFHPNGISPRAAHAAWIDGASLFVFGGTTSSTYLEKYNLYDHTWYVLDNPTSTVYPPPTRAAAFAHLATVGLGSDVTKKLFLISGLIPNENGTESVTNESYVYDYDPCYPVENCSTCASQTGCAWCTTRQTCISYNQTAGEPLFESCPHVLTDTDSCKVDECTGKTDCNSCVSAETMCGWCNYLYASPEPYAGCLPGNILGPNMGSCGSWVYQESSSDDISSLCEQAQPKLTFISPSSDTSLTPGDDVLIEYTITPELSGVVDIRYTVDGTETDDSEVVTDLPLYSPCLLVVPQLDNQTTATLTLIFVIHSEGSEGHITYEQNFTIYKPNINFVTPDSSTKLDGTAYNITFNRDNYKGPLNLVLRHFNTNNTNNRIIGWAITDDYYIWSKFSRIAPATDYYLTLQQPYTGVVLAESPVFSYLPAVNLTVSLDTNDTKLVSGDNVTISWNCSTAGSVFAVYLYLPKDDTDSSSTDSSDQNITLFGKKVSTISHGTSKKSVSYIVDVSAYSDDYYFVVEEVVTGNFAKTAFLTITPPSLIVTTQSERDSTLLIVGETITLSWTYCGYRSNKNVYLYDVSSEKILQSLGIVDEEATSFSWQVPDNLGSAYYSIHVISYWKSVTGVSDEFVISQPGQVSNPSYTLAFIFVSLTVLTIIVIMVVYLKVLKRKQFGAEAVN